MKRTKLIVLFLTAMALAESLMVQVGCAHGVLAVRREPDLLAVPKPIPPRVFADGTDDGMRPGDIVSIHAGAYLMDAAWVERYRGLAGLFPSMLGPLVLNADGTSSTISSVITAYRTLWIQAAKGRLPNISQT